MENNEFDIHRDFDFLVERLIELNGKEKVESHLQPMKVAYMMAVARMSECTDKFDNCSWEETAAMKASIHKQVFDWLESCEEDTIIGNMIAEVNTEYPLQVELKKPGFWRANAGNFVRLGLIVLGWIIIHYTLELLENLLGR